VGRPRKWDVVIPVLTPGQLRIGEIAKISVVFRSASQPFTSALVMSTVDSVTNSYGIKEGHEPALAKLRPQKVRNKTIMYLVEMVKIPRIIPHHGRKAGRPARIPGNHSNDGQGILSGSG
jgi:hypothetical protein